MCKCKDFDNKCIEVSPTRKREIPSHMEMSASNAHETAKTAQRNIDT